MTAADWLHCSDPIRMLDLLQTQGNPSARKLRLFAVACSRRVWAFLDDLGRGAVDLAELFAEGLTGAEELRAARLACKSAGGRAVWYAAASNPGIAARNVALSIQSGLDSDPAQTSERETQANFLRDIFGPTLRSIPFQPAWRTPHVLALGQIIYEEQSFEDMPKLAAVLVNAGCGNEDVLNHCRQPEAHVRGCWLLDGILRKE